MRALLVVSLSELIKRSLLSPSVPTWRRYRLRLQRSMKSFQSTVLFRMSRLYTLRYDPQLHPPHTQSRQSSKAHTRKRSPVVRPDTPRQSILPERPAQRPAHLIPSRLFQTPAHKKVSTRRILHRKRIDPLTIRGPYPSLEIHTPHVVGMLGSCERLRPPRCRPSTTSSLHQTHSLQYPSRSTRRWPAHLRLNHPQPRHHLLRSPRRVSTLRLYQPPRYLHTRTVRMTVRCSTPIPNPLHTVLVVSTDSLVSRLSADSISSAQTSYRILSPRPCLNKRSLLGGNTRVLPGHYITPHKIHSYSGTMCYPCDQSMCYQCTRSVPLQYLAGHLLPVVQAPQSVRSEEPGEQEPKSSASTLVHVVP